MQSTWRLDAAGRTVPVARLGLLRRVGIEVHLATGAVYPWFDEFNLESRFAMRAFKNGWHRPGAE